MDALVQVLFVLSWLVLLKFLQVSAYPLLRGPLGRLAYPVSFTGGILAFSALSWYLGLLRLPVALAALPFLGILGWAVIRGRYSRDDLKPQLRWDLVFLGAFTLMLLVRLANPAILSAEKFMDHAFIASIMRSPVIPPADPWYAGGTMNIYYYGGYWLLAVLGTLTGVPSQVVFNLALPTIFALAAVNLYAIGDLLLPRFRWFPLLTLILVNPAFVRDLIFGGAASGILWDSTRVITNTINEYTLFSFLWGDAHPHVLDIANQVFLLLILVIALRCWYKSGWNGRIALIALAALSLGTMPVTNTWDVLVYAPMTVLFGALIFWDGWRREKRDLSALAFLLAVPPISILLYLPYYLQMATTGYLGIFPVAAPSDPGEFLLVSGFFLAIFIAYGGRALARRPYLLVPAVLVALAGYPAAALAVAAATALLARWERDPGSSREPGSSRGDGGPSGPDPEILIALAGLAIITFCEFLYLKDYLGGIYYRMNTVFKFYNVAWILMGVSSLVMIGRVLGRLEIPKVSSGQVKAAAIVALAVIIVAVPALFAAAGAGSGGLTLDGLQYLEGTHPADAAALPFVRALPPGTVIAEGARGDYAYPSRISAFTGVETIIGWPGHEFMWRGAGGRTSGRIDDVRAVYEDQARSPVILRQYGVSYVYVGDTERELYHLDLPLDDLVPVYQAQGVTIYRFTG
jgi:YYY domain-containing protein